MKVLRTPDSRFEQISDFPFSPHYELLDDFEGSTLRCAYIDEGDVGAPVVLLMHGEPSWSYLYRKMIPPLLEAGFRCIAPDLIGFGRSDKPSLTTDYTYGRHVGWMHQLLIQKLQLNEITLFCQDWGGLIGLRIVGMEADRFARLVVANTGLPTGDERVSKAFNAWRDFSIQSDNFPIGDIVNGGSLGRLSQATIDAYNAPFPDDSYKVGARIFPSLVPISPDDPAHQDNLATWKTLSEFTNPVLCAFSDSDPITKGGEAKFIETIPGARGVQHRTIVNAGHFLQEESSEELAHLIIDFTKSRS